MALLAAVAAATAIVCLPTGAHAVVDGVGGLALASEGKGLNKVDGYCAFATTLPSSSFNTIRVAYQTSAHSSGPAVSTSVTCTLRPAPNTLTSYGSIGITAPGSDAAMVGEDDVPRSAPALYGCVKVNAAYLDGSQATDRPTEKCVPL